MKKLAASLLFFALIFASSAFAQTFNGTINTTWDTPGNWSANPFPSTTLTDATVASNAVVSSTGDFFGNISVNNNTSFTINSGANLNVGASGTAKNLTFSNSGTLTVTGTLDIWGDLVVNNSLTLSITGTMVVHGNVTMSNGGSLTVSGSGSLQVNGNVAGGNNTQITTSGSGTIAVSGSISTGGGTSSISGPGGSITAGGGCSLNGGSCGGTVLPIILISFDAKVSKYIDLKWSTAAELNFDYFSLQRSNDGTAFNEIAQVKGHGTTNEMHTYSYEDTNPIIGRSYYRLVSVDFDNFQETFKVILVDYQGEKRFHITPNPSDGSTLGLSFNFANDTDAQVIIYDNIGSVVGTYHIAGAGSINVDSQLKSGVYLAKYTSASFTRTERFIVK